MITESELRETLTRQAQTYDVPLPDLRGLRVAARRRRRQARVRYGALVGAVLLAVGATWGVLGSRAPDVRPADRGQDVATSPSCIPPGRTPPVPEVPYAGDGFLSDEPVTATPAGPGPTSCSLVLRYWTHRFGAGGGTPSPFTSYMLWLYSDGTLIVDTDDDSFVQWVRRLTPAGVERVRTMVATDLVGPFVRPHRDFEAAIRFRDGIHYPEDSGMLRQRFLDWSWLPDEYWVSETPSVYWAPWYVVCYMEPPVDRVLAAVRELPEGARDVLAARKWTHLPGSPAGDDLGGQGPAACVVVDRADAVTVAGALGGDVTDGRANVFVGESPVAPGFHLHALMPDGTSGAHGD